MPDTPQLLADRLLEESDRVASFFKDLSKEKWGIQIYPDESSWSLHHLLAHFVSSEIGRRQLIADIIAGGGGAPPEFDIDAYNRMEVEKLSGFSNEYLLELFLDERSQFIGLVSSLDTRDLELIGNDPYLGKVPVKEMIKLTYRHLQIHLRDARRLV